MLGHKLHLKKVSIGSINTNKEKVIGSINPHKEHAIG